jgi:hypothetical protein
MSTPRNTLEARSADRLPRTELKLAGVGAGL